jgi:hypothetical protein
MGAYTELVDFTFTADETSRAFSGLSITENDFIKIVFTHVNGSGSNSAVGLFADTTAGVSGFDTTTNYHRQILEGNSSTASASRDNSSFFSFTPGNEQSITTSYFKLSENGKVNFFTNQFRTLDSDLVNRFAYNTSSGLTFNDPITSLTFTSTVTDGLGDGSRIQIYRLDAEKVADITVASDATQVDISSLSIGKDDEYLLVSYFVNPIADAEAYNLTINDTTTLTNYYRQLIFGTDSTAAASRANNARFGAANANEKFVGYSHIKLSEIGAYTAQSYVIRNAGTTTPIIENSFVSSTSEAITSITKLNILAGTDGIGSGSRFELYKLK